MISTDEAMDIVDIFMTKMLGDYEYKVEWLDEYDHDYMYSVTFLHEGIKYCIECDKCDGIARVIKF